MTEYEIQAYEYKPGTEEPETYVVLVDGKDGPLFVTKAEAEAWIAEAKESD